VVLLLLVVVLLVLFLRETGGASLLLDSSTAGAARDWGDVLTLSEWRYRYRIFPPLRSSNPLTGRCNFSGCCRMRTEP